VFEILSCREAGANYSCAAIRARSAARSSQVL